MFFEYCQTSSVDYGRAFHTVGAAMEKARLPMTVLVRGTISLFAQPERSERAGARGMRSGYCQTRAGYPRTSFFVFQQDGAPAHRARDTITYLEQQTPGFCKVRTLVGACSWGPTYGCGYCRPLSIHTAPPTSPCSNVLHERRDGSPSGELTAPPALSLRTEGAKALSPPPCTGIRGEETPRPE